MTVDLTQPIVFDAANNGYIVTLDNGWPYEVLSEDPLMPSITAWLAAGNTAQPYVPPAAVPPNPVAVAQQTLAQMTQAAINNLVAIPANATAFGAAFIQAWKAAWKAAGN